MVFLTSVFVFFLFFFNIGNQDDQQWQCPQSSLISHSLSALCSDWNMAVAAVINQEPSPLHPPSTSELNLANYIVGYVTC